MVQKPELAGDVGCGAVWGENLPCHTHPKLLLISSDVPVYEMIVGTVVTGIKLLCTNQENTDDKYSTGISLD